MLSRTLSSRNIKTCSLMVRHYAIKSASPAIAGLGKKSRDKSGGLNKKVKLPVETDPHKLVNYVCGSNLMQTGEDVKLRPDNEYPEWLWKIHTGPRKRLEDYEPGTKEHLELLKKINIAKAVQLRNLSKIKQE